MSDLAEKHRHRGVLIDTNILLLLCVGTHDRDLVERFKRTEQFTADDFDTLQRFLAGFARIITTPHVMTELSNLAGQIAEPARSNIFTLLAPVAASAEEQYVPTVDLSQRQEFVRFGLTDAAIITEADGGVLILTDDLRLYQFLLSRGRDAVNFNHLRVF